MTGKSQGLSLIELLIALAIISIAFLALALSQVSSLRASTRSQLLTSVKSAGNLVLEQVSAEVLKTVALSGLTTCDSANLCDQTDSSTGTKRFLSYKFIDYYHYCASGSPSSGLRNTFRSQVSGVPSDSQVAQCTGTVTVAPNTVAWSVSAPPSSGYDAEGVLDITVSVSNPQGSGITLGNTITCYDVYPAPKKDTPRPCPDPELP